MERLYDYLSVRVSLIFGRSASMKYFLGIDPGLSGAFAFFNPLAEEPLVIWDMPLHTIKVAGKEKRTLDLVGIANIVDNMADTTEMAIIEQVNAMPKQGVTSSFSFGFAAGAAQMAVAANFIPFTTARPDVWKREMRITKDKEGARREASRLFPKNAGLFQRAKDDGRAEAALLAYYLAKRRIN